MGFHEYFGVAAGILALADFGFYALGILGRDYRWHKIVQRTVPNRVTWFIWAAIGAITVASYKASGATDTIWFPVAYAVGFAVIALLSIKYGEGGSKITDVFCLSGAVLAVLGWWWFNSPQIALTTALLIETFAAIPTILKSWREPWKENRLAWTLAILASSANILALEWRGANFWVILFPLYIFILNAFITLPLYLKHRESVARSP